MKRKMKSNFALTLAILFTIFSMPLNGLTVSAAVKNYDDIKDGTYEVTAKAMHASQDKKSGAAGFINEAAKLSIKDGKAELIISTPDSPIASIEGIQIENKKAEVKKGDGLTSHSFKLAELKKELSSQVHYVVPSMDMNEKEPFKFILEGLDKLPKKDKVKVKTETDKKVVKFKTVEEKDSKLDKGKTKVKQEGKNGEKTIKTKITLTNGKETDRTKSESVTKKPVNKIILIGTKEPKPETKPEPEVKPEKPTEKPTEKPGEPVEVEKPEKNPENTGSLIENPDKTTELEYKSGIDLERNFKNPVKLIEKDGKKYIHMTGTGGQFIDSLTIDGQKAILGEVDKKGNYVMQFEITKSLDTKLDFNMVIDTGDAGYGIMEHDTTLWFEDESAPQKEDTIINNADKTKELQYQVSEKRTEDHFSNPAKLVEKNGKKYIQMNGSGGNHVEQLTIDGQKAIIGDVKEDGTYVMQFEITKSIDTKLQFVMTIDTGVPSLGDNGVMSHGTDLWFEETTNSKPQANTQEKPKPLVKPVVEKDSEKAYTIDYVIKHEDGKKESIANDFFTNKAKLLVKNGKTYTQLTITDGSMVKGLENEHGKAVIVKENKDGSVVIQLIVDNNLANSLLDMHIIVPGLYEAEHKATLVFDKSSKKEIALDEKVDHKTDDKKTPVKKEKKKKVKVTKNNKLNAEKTSKINYTIKHEDGIKDSVANDFFTNKGILLEKDGKTYVQMTITNGEMVKALKNKYGKAIVVKQNKDGSIVVQLRVENNLSNMLLDMHIVVPAMPGFEGYNTTHKALLVFDKNSKQKIDVGDHMIADNEDGNPVSKLGTNGTEEIIAGLKNLDFNKPKFGINNTDEIIAGLKNNDLDKPEFGLNSNGNKTGSNTPTNPQTGDVSTIIFYTLLLLGSMIPLAIQFRRRRV